ncbi:MAG: TolB family protein, partial [Actinomycetota bacterium]
MKPRAVDRGRGTPRKARSTLWLVMVGAILGAGLQPASAYPRPGRTELVSVASDGSQARSLPAAACLSPHFEYSDVTPEGRYVVFASAAYNLVDQVGGDTNAACDVFVRDRVTKRTELVSVASDGTQGRGDSGAPSISADGRFVAFLSDAPNLVVGDTNLSRDAFVHDRRRGVTRRVNVSSDGEQALRVPWATSNWLEISANGRYVAFASLADNLVEGDTDGGEDVYVHDLKTGQTVMASVDSQGAQAPGDVPSVSRTGRYVVFSSSADNLVPGDGNLAQDVFVHDLRTNKTVRVSVASDGTEAFCPTPPSTDATFLFCFSRTIDRGGRQISSNGRYVTYTSGASNLVPNDTNDPTGAEARNDSFVHDLKTGRTERVSVTSFGGQLERGGLYNAISPSGRYVGFNVCNSDEFLGIQGVPVLGGCDTGEVYVHDRVTGFLTVASTKANGKRSDGGPCNAGFLRGGAGPASFGTAVNDRGDIAFWSCNPDLVAGDSNDAMDYFVRDLGPVLGIGGFAEANPGGEPPDDRICITPEICIPPGGSIVFADRSEDADVPLNARGADLI